MNRFRFAAGRRCRYGVEWLCTVPGIVRSSFCCWRRTAAGRVVRQAADVRLAARTRVVHRESEGVYGAPRVTAEFREAGEGINRKRVARVVRGIDLAGVWLCRRHRSAVADPAAAKAPDLIGRDSTATEPNTKYVGDITHLPVDGGKFLYLATVVDLASRHLAGWALADHMRTDLVTDAPATAERCRGSLPARTRPGVRRRLPQGRRPPVHERDRLRRGHRSPITYEAASRTASTTLTPAA